jgi:hypothetical protein
MPRNVPTTSSPHSSPGRGADMDHREWIAGQIATVLSFYWQPEESLAVAAAAGGMWADALERFSRDEIRTACTRWVHTQTRRPTPADIIRLCADARPRPRLVELPAPQRERSPEEIARIDALMREAGFAPRRFPGEDAF